MGKFGINKTQGAFISFLIMAPYFYVYYINFVGVPYFPQLFLLFAFGILLHFVQLVPPGEQVELAFWKKATGKFWSDGYCLVPTAPILDALFLHVLWSLMLFSYREHVNRQFVNIDQYSDQSRASYVTRSDMSPFWAAASRLTGNIFYWFMNFEKGDPVYLYQRIGRRIMVLALILSCLASIPRMLQSNLIEREHERQVQAMQQESVPSAHAQQGAVQPVIQEDRAQPQQYFDSGNQGGEVYVQLNVGMEAVRPTPERFAAMSGTTNYYFFVTDTKPEDHRKYYRFTKAPPGKIRTLEVTESLCAVIPAGMEMAFVTKFPPQFAVNMEGKVEYVKKQEALTSLEEAFVTIRNLKPTDVEKSQDLVKNASWEHIHQYWSREVNTDYHLRVTALPKSHLTSGNLGGIVCF